MPALDMEGRGKFVIERFPPGIKRDGFYVLDNGRIQLSRAFMDNTEVVVRKVIRGIK